MKYDSQCICVIRDFPHIATKRIIQLRILSNKLDRMNHPIFVVENKNKKEKKNKIPKCNSPVFE